MRLFTALLCLTLAGSTAIAAEPPKDTFPASFTRTKKLKGKVTVDFKNEFLKEALKELSSQLEDQKLGALSVHYGVGVSQNTRITYAGKDVTAEVALDGILKQLDLGYFVVSKDKDRYDGWIELGKGMFRGYPPGVDAPKGTEVVATEPKKPEEPKKTDPEPAGNDPDEKNAMLRLEAAKKLIADGKIDEAKPLLKFAARYFPKTKAGAEAKELLEKNK